MWRYFARLVGLPAARDSPAQLPVLTSCRFSRVTNRPAHDFAQNLLEMQIPLAGTVTR